MLISHTTQMVSRDQIHNEKKISSSISFTLKNEKKKKRYRHGLNFCQSVYLSLDILYLLFGVTLTSRLGSYFEPTHQR